MPTELDAAVCLSRFGLGARAGSLVAISSDPRGALRQEVTSRNLANPTGGSLRPTPELLVDLFAFEKQKRAERERNGTGNATSGAADPQMAGRTPAGQRNGGAAMQNGAPAATPAMDYQPFRVFLAEVDARFNGTMRDPVIGFPERLTMFWSNQFAVAVSKGPQLRVLAGAFEREAIRPHVFGRFEEMLLAAETHPAMLAFLDNQQSIGPVLALVQSEASTRIWPVKSWNSIRWA